MTVECPACKTIFPVDPNKVPAGGVHARCSTCSQVFFVEPPPPPRELQEGDTGEPRGAHHGEAVGPEEGTKVEAAAGGPEEPPAVPSEAEAVEALPELPEPEPVEEEPVSEVGWYDGAPEPEEPEAEAVEALPELPEPEPEPVEEEPVSEVGWYDESPEPEEPEAEAVEALPELPEPEPVEEEPVSEEAWAPEAPLRATEPTFGDPEPTFTMDSPTLGGPPPREVPLQEDAPDTPALASAETPPTAGPLFGRRDPMDKAQRLARVLVSDIVLYNPDRHRLAMNTGRAREEFAEEIRKSWTEYVEQVGEEIATSTSFFDDALTEIL